mgnify:CR=1 FL=1
MKRLLMITSRNILTSCGELRLIKNRAEYLYKDYNVATDFITFGISSRLKSKRREKIEAGGKTEIIPVRSMAIVPLAMKKSIALIDKFIVSYNYDGIILSGVGTLQLVKYLKETYRINVYCDVHGALEDSYELAKSESFLKKMRFLMIYRYEHFLFSKNTKDIDGFLVVTNALKDYINDRFKVSNKAKFYIIPCATSTVEMDNSSYSSYRKQYREKYGIDDETKVFIYSGGISNWQCIDETVELYKQIAYEIKGKTKLLMFSHNIDALKAITGKGETISFDSYLPDELEKALCAGDFAFLLRKDCITNNVAFPNKFLEYVRSRLRIITTPYVYEIANQVNANSLGYIWDFDKEISGLKSFVEEMYNPMNTVETLQKNSFNYTLKQFVKDIENETIKE